MKKIVYLLSIILVLSSIFFFSSKSSVESNGFSKKLINNTVGIIEKIIDKDLNNKELIDNFNYPIRKIAHFTIFLILGIFVLLFINTFNNNHAISVSILICIMFAALDETHQFFSIGRSPLILDIFIDAIGSINGILITNKIIKKKEHSYK